MSRPILLTKQCGVAIIMALFMMALMATMAYFMMMRLDRDTRRTTLVVQDIRANFYSQGVLAWAQATLVDDWQKQKPNQVIDAIPIQSPVNQENGFTISATLTDAQARFNLNTLTDSNAQAQFGKLIQLLAPTFTQEQIATIVNATVEWISPASTGARNDEYYADLNPPYRIPHHIMTSSSELQLVKGMTPALYQTLTPYIIALPEATPINVQTASAPMLASLSPDMTLDAAKAVEQIRIQSPFTSIDGFGNIDIIKNHHVPINNMTVFSQYFLLTTTITQDDQKIILYTLLERITNDKKVSVQPIWQSKSILG